MGSEAPGAVRCASGEVNLKEAEIPDTTNVTLTLG